MKIIKSLFLILTILLFVACKDSQSDKKSFKITEIEYKENNSKYKYDISIPEIQNVSSEDISYLNLALQENARIIIDSFSTDNSDEDLSGKLQKDAMVSYDIKENNFDILSIVLDTYVYQGNGETVGYIETYNLSKKTLTLVNFDDIFTVSAGLYFEKMIKENIKKVKDVKVISRKLKDEGAQEYMDFSDVDFKIRSGVLYFEGDNVVFVYPEYEIKNAPFKMPVFKFKKQDIKEYLK